MSSFLKYKQKRRAANMLEKSKCVKQASQRQKTITTHLPKESPTSVTLSFMHKTQRPILIRWLFFIFLLAHENMSVGLADNSVAIFPSLEMEVGRYLHSCPTVSESQTLQKGWGVQAQPWWLLVNVTQLCFPINCRWKLASRFVPLWSVCLAQKDQNMVERGLCIWGGMCSTFRLMKPLHFPLPQLALHRLSHPWSKGEITGPLSAVLAQSPMVGECGCGGAMRSLPHFWCPGVWEGRRSICFWFPPPEWLGTGFETT